MNYTIVEIIYFSSNSPEQDLVFHILLSNINIANKWDISPLKRNMFISMFLVIKVFYTELK